MLENSNYFYFAQHIMFIIFSPGIFSKEYSMSNFTINHLI